MSTSSVRRALRATLRSPSGLRRMMLATEVLGPPIALRGRRAPRPVSRGPATAGPVRPVNGAHVNGDHGAGAAPGSD